MKIGSDWEAALARAAQLAGVAALVAAQPSRDAKLAALAQALGGLTGASRDEQLADAEARAVTPRARPAPGLSPKPRAKKIRRQSSPRRK